MKTGETVHGVNPRCCLCSRHNPRRHRPTHH